MKDILRDLVGEFNFKENLREDAINLLNRFDKVVISEHTLRVAGQAKELAELFGEDVQKAEIAGLLHDISGIIPNDRRLEFAEALSVEILPEERPYPFILHQKLSAGIAKSLFGITDNQILSAIGCHTTLKANAGPLDLILFVSDKLQWDQNHTPPYLNELNKGLSLSLQHGAFAFVKYQMENQSDLMMVHPWLVAAYKDLEVKI